MCSLRIGAAASVILIAWTVHPRTGSVSSASDGLSASSAFVGADACAACHRQIYDSWKSGRHSKMVQPATPASVKGDFSRSRVTLRGSRYGLRIAGGEYFITESYVTGKEQEHRVEYTLGNRRVQHYLTTIDKGRIIVLPPSWDVQRREWFHNMEIVRPDESSGTPIQQWNKDCVGCHVSQQDQNYRPADDSYSTQWVDFGTSCERCHGPGRAHVAAYSGKQGAATSDRLIVKPTRLDPNTSSMICAQCHSLRNVIAPGFKAGDDYYDYFSPRLAYDMDQSHAEPYWGDGRPRRFSNDALGFWQSRCFLEGRAACTDCHRNPHEPDVDRNPQLAPSDNSLCTKCHQALAADPVGHTRHAANSRGSSCVECHMPKTVVGVKATMRDHAIGVPVPENTEAFGIPNACTVCHEGKSAQWAAGVLNQWWPKARRGRIVSQARAFSLAHSGSPEAVERLRAIVADEAYGPLTQATAVGYLRRYDDPRAADVLLRSAHASHPAVRVAAIASLGFRGAGAGDGPVRSTLLAALDDPRRAVRIAAMTSLINVRVTGLTSADLERFRRVGREYSALAPLYQDDAAFDRDLGMVHLLDNDLDEAAGALQISLRLQPDLASARFLLALTRLGQGRIADARMLLSQVPASDPSYAAARRRLSALK